MTADAGRAPQERGALVAWLADQIHAEILEGRFAVGSWLRQGELAARYSVSRTPVREALRSLDARGVVDVLPRRGALVRGPTPREIRDAYQVRAALEGLAAEMAARRLSADDLAQLRKAELLFASATEQLIAEPSAGDGREAWAQDWISANETFHGVVVDASGNRRLKEFITALHRSFPRNVTWTAIADRPTLLEENVAQHAAVRQALEAGDGTRARDELRHHVEQAGELVARLFEDRLEKGEG